MADLSGRNVSSLFNVDDSNGHGGRFRSRLALDLANPSEKRNRISSLSDLALQEIPSSPFIRRDDGGEKAILLTPTPTQFLFPKHVTEEQEAYAHGFERALEEIYKEKGPPLADAVTSSDSTTVKDENKHPSDSNMDTSNVSISESSSTTAHVTAAQNGGLLQTHIPFSQCVSRASFANESFRNSNVLSSSCLGSATNFNFALPGGCVTQTGALPVVPSGGGGSQQHFQQDKKVVMSEPLIYNCSLNVGPPHPVLFQSSHAAVSSTAFPSIVREAEVASMISMTTQPVTAVSSCARNWTVAEVPVANKISSLDCGTFPLQTQPGFNKFETNRTQVSASLSNAFHPDAANTTIPASIFCQMTGVQTTSSAWSCMSVADQSTSTHQWLPAKHEVTPLGAVDMDQQERLKLERKRAKNRVAAQRCQMRKLERIARLEDKAEKLREQNSKLLQTVDALRKHISQLKTQITSHANKGCRLMLPDVSVSSASIVSS